MTARSAEAVYRERTARGMDPAKAERLLVLDRLHYDHLMHGAPLPRGYSREYQELTAVSGVSHRTPEERYQARVDSGMSEKEARRYFRQDKAAEAAKRATVATLRAGKRGRAKLEAWAVSGLSPLGVQGLDGSTSKCPEAPEEAEASHPATTARYLPWGVALLGGAALYAWGQT